MFAPSMLTARQNAVVEDVDMKAARGLDKSTIEELIAAVKRQALAPAQRS